MKMGRRGPKTTPTNVLKLRGSWRGKQRGADLKLDQKRPPCPKSLIERRKTEDGEAVRVIAKSTWDRLAPLLHEAGLLTNAYREPFELLCDSYARWKFACRQCDEEGMVSLVGENKTPTQSPWVAIRNKMYEQVYKAAACFGLTPADLSSVRAVEKPSADDKKASFFERTA